VSVFKDYAFYYDLLYHDKDYNAETEYIYNLIKKYKKDAQNILELGCGTGKHAILLAEKELNIFGVDISQEMINKAQKRVKEHKNLSNRFNFYLGDIRNVNLNKKFDLVLSLFHVISYQTNNQDLQNVLLDKNGIFIFDVWYGPAVLNCKPETRVKRFEDENILLTRIAEPKIDFNNNIVDVNYQILIIDKLNNTVKEFKETHKMRYFFKPELEFFLKNNNFELLDYQEWLSGDTPTLNSWGVSFICRKI